MKRKSKKIRWRKNPDFEFDNFTLIELIFGGSKRFLSNVIRRSEMNKDEVICNDCDESYWNCTCEGDSIRYNDPENFLSGPCRDCKQNRCICDLNLKNQEDVAKFAWSLSKRKNDKDFEKFLSTLYSSAKKDLIGTKLAAKIINAIESGWSFNEIREI